MKNKISEIYSLLYGTYGAQGWWPVTPVGGCGGNVQDFPIYGISLKNDKQKLEVALGAILTQNTSWKNVEKAVIELNKHNLIDINKILRTKHEKLANIIRSSGYYNQKAKKLKALCTFLIFTPLSKLAKMDVWHARKELLKINGVGKETADSILLYALNKPIFIIDAYTKRIFGKLGLKESEYDDLQKLFMKSLTPDSKIFNEYHALLVQLAKNHCKKKPVCPSCPLQNFCKNK
jgi:endonuclease-3 related protein